MKGVPLRLVVVSLLAGCGAAAPVASRAPVVTATASPTDTFTPVDTLAPVTPSATAVPTPPPATAVPTPPLPAALSGYGATVADWNAAHTASSSCTPGACYNDDPALAPVNGHVGSHYFAVSVSLGRVLNYYMAFRSGTSQAEATAAVLQEFPSDVRTLWVATKDTCVQVELRSATLGTVLGEPAIGDAQGDVFVEFDSDSDTAGSPSYSASSVREAILNLGSYATAADGPLC